MTARAAGSAKTAPASTNVNMKMVEVLHAGLARHQAGDFDAAEAAYREVLAHHADNPDALNLLGAICRTRGDLQEAVSLIGRAVEINPNNASFHTNLGVVLGATGSREEAEHHYRRALALNPTEANALGNLGNLLRERGELDEAIQHFEGAIRFNPAVRAVHRSLASLYIDKGRLDEAEILLGQFLAAVPEDGEANNNFAYVLEQRGALADAEPFYRRAYAAAPQSAEIASNLGNVLRKLGRPDEAAPFFAAALALKPDDFQLMANAVSAMTAARRHDQALPLVERMVAAQPDNADVHNDYGLCLAAIGKLVEASAHFARAAALAPQRPELLFNLGTAMLGRNHYGDAIAAFRAALQVAPRDVKVHANLCQVLKLNRQYDEANIYGHATMMLEGWKPRMFPAVVPAFRATCDLDAIDSLGDMFAACAEVPEHTLLGGFLDMLNLVDSEEKCLAFADLHRRWGNAMVAHAARNPIAPAVGGGGGDKLRIGILSSDLRAHAVSKFLMPWLSGYDRSRFEIHCYSPLDAPSDLQQQAIRGHVDAFHVVENLSDRDIAERIRADGVDILIELNGATHNGRLGALAYKPAPVQIMWLGYPFTSGLASVDYSLQDHLLKPAMDGLWVERVLEMANRGPWIAFADFPDEPITDTLPFETNGYVTFGTMNAIYKFTHEIFALWARVMHAVPDSRFLFVRPELKSTIAIGNIVKEFARHGIGAERLMVIANESGQFGHFAHYNEIDISLDTFPVVGGTTSCDALWMGVPVIGRYGINTHQRVNHAILGHCGLEEFSVPTEEAYVARAVELAADGARLKALRRTLRGIVAASPLCDGASFTRNIERTLTEVASRHGLGR